MSHGPQIALTPQTDERNFPKWQLNAPAGKSGHAYPKMLTRLCTKQDRDEWIEKNRKIDRTTREEYWDERPPRVGSPIPVLATDELVDAGLADVMGDPVTVQSAADEVKVKAMLGIEAAPAPAGTVKIPIHSPIDLDDDVDPVVQENTMLKSALAKMQAQMDRLTAAPAKAADPKSTKKKPKRKKRAAALRTVSLEQMAETGDED